MRLRDGRSVVLRAIEPHDRECLQAAVKALSPDSRYARFMNSLRELSPRMLEQAINPVPGRELQIVAVFDDGSGEGIVGGARYSGAQGSKDCEFAVTVADRWHGLGLARELMQALMRQAAAQGFRSMEGYVLASNSPMLALAKRLGFRESQTPGDATCRTVRRSLDELA